MGKRSTDKIDCAKCPAMHNCCKTGACVDLEEAKKIIKLKLKGEFFHLEEDSDFPSGYFVATSYDDTPCTFLDEEGLCTIHKVDYNLKPAYCIEFPYEDGKLSEFIEDLCLLHKKEPQKRKKRK